MIKNIFLAVLFFAVFALCGDKHYRGIVDFTFDVAKGNIPGHSSINKFGHNPAVATGGEDVWSGGGTYAFYPDTACGMELVSDSATDDSAGTGARSVQVFGLDSNWLEINETVIADGDTVRPLANKYIRMYRAKVLTAGTGETNAGNIAIRIVGASDTGAFIAAGDGQTQQAIYTIPGGKTGYIVKWYVAMRNDDKNGQDASFKWKARPNNGGAGAWQTKGDISLINIGSSWWKYPYGVPSGPLVEKTDIRIECYDASATVGATAGFDLVLVDD